MSKKKRIYTIIQIGSIDDIPSRTYDIALMLAVVINIFIAIFETFPQSDRYLYILRVVESITVLFFTIDYLLRIWTATYLYKGVTVARARRKFIFSWAGIVDFYPACHIICLSFSPELQSHCGCSESSGFCVSSASTTTLTP